LHLKKLNILDNIVLKVIFVRESMTAFIPVNFILFEAFNSDENKTQ